MKIKITILLLLISHFSFSQNVDFNLIKYKGLGLYSPKSEIIQTLGESIKYFEPKYDCGFLSESEQTLKFYSLDYSNVKFTGNIKDQFLIELINFEDDNSIILNYGKHRLNCETKLKHLALIFGEKIIE